MLSAEIRKCRRSWLALLPAVLAPLAAQQVNSLSIAGQTGSAQVIRVHGRNYVDVEDLARITGASIQFSGTQMVMNIGDAARPTAAQPGFSKNFLNTSIEAMAEQREWRAALKFAIDGGYPLTESWLAVFGAKAQEALQKAMVSATTPSDKDAASLLTGQFTRMTDLSNKYLGMATSLSYIAPNSLTNDSLDQKILACNSSLTSMASADHFIDDGSCR